MPNIKFIKVLKSVGVEVDEIPVFKGDFVEVINQKGSTYVITTYGIYEIKREVVRESFNSPDESKHSYKLVALFEDKQNAGD